MEIYSVRVLLELHWMDHGHVQILSQEACRGVLADTSRSRTGHHRIRSVLSVFDLPLRMEGIFPHHGRTGFQHDPARLAGVPTEEIRHSTGARDFNYK